MIKKELKKLRVENMGKNHLKRLTAPKSWHVERKFAKFITRPSPGAHSLSVGMSVNTLLKEKLKLARTTKETKFLLNNGEILVDKKKVNNHKFTVGFMDVISIPKIKRHLRVLIDKKGRLLMQEIDEKESNIKLCKIANKNILGKDRVQINLTDGRNITIKKNDYKAGDTLVIALPEQTVKESLPLEKKSWVILTEGKHTGVIGAIEDISQDTVMLKTKKEGSFETLKRFVFVIGKDKPIIKISE